MANSASKIVYAAIKELVANGDGTYRCYPNKANDSAQPPFIVFQRVGGQPSNTLNGLAGIRNARIQVTAWASTENDAIDLMEQVIAALTMDAIKAVMIGEPDDGEDPETKIPYSRQDFSVWFYP